MCIVRPKFQLCKIILKYVYFTVYSRLNICSLIEINFSLCKLFIFLNILSLSQEIISVYFNYPFSGIKTQKPDKTLCLIAMLIIYRYTISINFLHMFCRVPDVSVPSPTRSANSWISMLYVNCLLYTLTLPTICSV